ncbi:hypothetical protein ACFLV5_06160 [Chloroflexota bacterium]
MESFAISGKAKSVFQIIYLLAKGEEYSKKQEAAEKKRGLISLETGGTYRENGRTI